MARALSQLRLVGVYGPYSVLHDLSIGYLSHTDSIVELYLLETFAFRVLTSEAAVILSPSRKSL